MTDRAVETMPVRRRFYQRRGVRWTGFVLGALAGLTLLAAAFLVLLDTQPGHRFLIDRIEQQSPKNGLRIKIGRIDGSIYGRASVRMLQLADPKGVFFTANEAKLDWNPVGFALRNKLDIRDLWIAKGDLLRLPNLIKDPEQKRILPTFNIALDHARVDNLIVNEAVAGRYYNVALDGGASVRGDRATVNATLHSRTTTDRADFHLIAIPDADVFDVSADIVAPADGLIAGMTGVRQPVGLSLSGNGGWKKWTGALVATSDKATLANLYLTATDGLYTAVGTVSPDRFIANPLVKRIAGGGVRIDARSRFDDKVLDGRLALSAATMRAVVTGKVDTDQQRFGGLVLDAKLLRPDALLKGASGRDIQVNARLDGPFKAPSYRYRLTADSARFNKTQLNAVDLRGRGNWSAGIIQRLPFEARIASVTGNGAQADALLRNVRVDGVLNLRGQELTGNNIRLRTSGIDGALALAANFRTGGYTLGFDGRLPGYEIPGLGRIDLATDIKAMGGGGRALSLIGKADALVRRLDNAFLKSIAGGNPRLTTDLRFQPGGRIDFNNLRIVAPLINAVANGYRGADGLFHVTGSGNHKTYGPVKLALDGNISRPKVAMVLASPMPAAGLKDVAVNLDPTAAGYLFRTSGQSRLGAFSGNGAILMGKGGTVIDISRLMVGETALSGQLRPVSGGMNGTLAVAGGGLDGTIILSVPAGTQQVAVDLVARDAAFPGPPAVRIGNGVIRGTALFAKGGPTINVHVDATDVDANGMRFASINADIAMANGAGSVNGEIVGRGSRSLSFNGRADFNASGIRVSGAGSFAGQPVGFRQPMLITRDGDGWRLAATEFTYGGGRVRAAGLFGGRNTEFDAALFDMPLDVLDAINPTLQIGGIANGVVQYRDTASGPPSGQAELRIANLSRSGLALSSQPVDLAVNTALDSKGASVRAVIINAGQVIGRVQALASPLPGKGTLMERLMAAPLQAQARYNGAADTLWRLTGLDVIDVSGPIAIAADVGGTLNNPQIDGAVQAKGARLENGVTGAVLNNVQAIGRFNGSRLEMRQFTGETPENGTIAGSGSIEFSAERGLAMDIRIDAKHAQVLNRDDLKAVVTGPIALQSDRNGGVVSGNVIIDEGTFTLGQAKAVQALPQINVREINLPKVQTDDAAAAPTSPWKFDIVAKAEDNLRVRGLGLDSLWSADLVVGGSVAEPRISGTTKLIRGDYQFAGRLFRLSNGNIRFTGTTPIDPILDIVAESDVQGLNARINIGGTGQKPEITFSSTPALPQDELLSRILFGQSITNISVAEAAQLGAALASFQGGGGGLDPINSLREAAGLDRLRILSADELTGRKTAVAVGKYITRRFYAEIITDGQGYSATQLEFNITRWLSVLGSVSTMGRHSANVKIQRDY